MSTLQSIRQHLADEEKKQAEQKKKRGEVYLEEVKAKVIAEFGEELLGELQAEYRLGNTNYLEPIVTLHYRGRSGDFTVGGRTSWSNILTREGIAKWADEIDRAIEKAQREQEVARKELLALSQASYWNLGILRDAQSKAKKHGLADDPEIQATLDAYQAAIQADEEARERNKQEQYQRKIQEYAEQAEAATTWGDLRSPQDAVEYRDPDNFPEWAPVFEALAQARERIQAAEDERKAALAIATADAFRPFAFYRVFYGVVAYDGGDGYVDLAQFDTLAPAANDKGWWFPADGNVPMQVAHLVRVECHLVEEPDDLPYWCPRQETRWGKIRVPPKGAQAAPF